MNILIIFITVVSIISAIISSILFYFIISWSKEEDLIKKEHENLGKPYKQRDYTTAAIIVFLILLVSISWIISAGIYYA